MLIYQGENHFLASPYFLDTFQFLLYSSYRHLVLFLPEGLNVIYPKSIAYRT